MPPLLFRPKKDAGEFGPKFERENADFARHFQLVADLMEKAGALDNSEGFALYLSTCRNPYLTINAMFFDIREAFGKVTPFAGLLGALQLGRSESFEAMKEVVSGAAGSLGSFEDKNKCWEDRLKFQGQLESLVSGYPHLDQQILRETLSEVADRDESCELSNISQFLAFDSSENNDQKFLLQMLRDVHAKLKLVCRCCEVMLAIALSEQDTFDQPGLFDSTAVNINPGRVIAKLESLLDSAGGDATTQVIADALKNCSREYATARKENRLELWRKFIAVFAEHLQFSVGTEYHNYGKFFRPNVGKPPLPSLFWIDLSAKTARTPNDEDSVAIHPIPLSSPSPSSITIAIAHPPFSSSVIDPRNVRYSSDEYRQMAEDWACLAIKEASPEVKLIVFPELFIPNTAVAKIREEAKKHSIAVICGEEGFWLDTEYYNRAKIIISDRGEDYEQYKKYPSNLEPQAMRTKGGQHCFHGSSIGSFSVILCSDYREFDVIAAIEAQPFLDFVVICSCNEYYALWKQMALADAARLHSFFLISNWSEKSDEFGFGIGSCCAGPLQNPETESKFQQVKLTTKTTAVHGGFTVYNLKLASLFHDRSKPGKNFLAPPYRRLRLQKVKPNIS